MRVGVGMDGFLFIVVENELGYLAVCEIFSVTILLLGEYYCHYGYFSR